MLRDYLNSKRARIGACAFVAWTLIMGILMFKLANPGARDIPLKELIQALVDKDLAGYAQAIDPSLRTYNSVEEYMRPQRYFQMSYDLEGHERTLDIRTDDRNEAADIALIVKLVEHGIRSKGHKDYHKRLSILAAIYLFPLLLVAGLAWRKHKRSATPGADAPHSAATPQ